MWYNMGVKKKTKTKTQAQLKKELDKIFSLWVRQSWANNDGMVSCYTCGKVAHWKQMHAGHFIPRHYLITRWDENNVRPQCVGDNIFGNGKPLDFEERLKKEIGEKKVEDMKKKRHLIMKVDSNWYLKQIEVYQQKLLKLSTQ